MKIRDKRDKNWFVVDNDYLNGYAKHLGVNCTVVYLSLCRHSNNETQQCYPSMKLIADENGIHKSTVIRAVKKLEEWNIVNVKREKVKRKEGKQTPNLYTLLDKSVWGKQQGRTKELCHRVAQNEEQGCTELKSRVAQNYRNYTNINNTNITILKTENVKNLFNKFWEEYPNKVSKQKAQKYFNSIISKSKEKEKLFEEILNGLRKYKKTNQWLGENGKYIPHPTTWLNNARWEDEIKINRESKLPKL